MDLKEALALSVDLWKYLYENPKIDNKLHTPFATQLMNLHSYCPLCDLFAVKSYRAAVCEGKCRLYNFVENNKCRTNCGYYAKWIQAKTSRTRKKYAGIIYDILHKWQEEETK